MPFSLLALDLLLARRRRRHERDLREPRVAQLRRLAQLLAANHDTVFGRQHDFAALLRAGGLEDLAGSPKRRRAFAATPADRLARDWNPADRAAFAAAWRAAVPPRAYDGFSDWIERQANGEDAVLTAEPPIMFSLTSGTVAEPKRCPVTRAFIREHHDTHLLWMQRLLHDHTAIMNGKYLIFTSPAVVGYTRAGIPFGSSSGRQSAEQSWPVRRRQAVPAAVFACDPPPYKYHAVLVHALGKNMTLALTVNPSTLVLLADRLEARAEALIEDVASGRLDHAPSASEASAATAQRLALAPQRKRAAFLRERLRVDGRLTPAAAWPNLALLATWQGGCALFYRRAVEEAWGPLPQRCLGLRASEGTFTIPDRDDRSDGTLAVGGHLVEFFPEDCDPQREAETALWADELQEGKRYRMVITTGAGFYRYDLADVVEVAGYDGPTPRLAFIRRAGGVASVSGEKVTEDQVASALGRACIHVSGLRLNGYTVGIEWGRPPAYVLAVEPRADGNGNGDGGAPDMELQRRLMGLAHEFDESLGGLNSEYRDRRLGGRLGSVRVWVAVSGSYAGLRESLTSGGGRPDGQWKPPVLAPPHPEGPFVNAKGFERMTWVAKLK